MEDQLQDLARFLRLDTRLDLKTVALDYVLGLTGSKEGRAVIGKQGSILTLLLDLTTDKHQDISHNSYLAVLNLSGYEEFAAKFIDLKVIHRLLEFLTSPSPVVDADTICMILSNLTRTDKGTKSFMAAMESLNGPVTLHKLVDLFDKNDSSHGRPLHYLSSVFSNITSTSSARLMFLDKPVCLLPRLLPYVQFKESLVRRGGVVGLMRNLCFETSFHSWLLGPDVDILSALLLPLAGPEQFSEEDNDYLPLDLQYLPDDKERECDPDIRKMLLESLLKLCATKEGRQFLRDNNTYLVLRELHQWEKEEDVGVACENVISMLIADEPETGMENLEKVEIPQDVVGKLKGCGRDQGEETNRIDNQQNQT